MGERKLRCGFTTGTCAAAAAGGAAQLLLTGETDGYMNIVTPKGTEAHLPLFKCVMEKESASCAVKKDAGDDPDVTDGAWVFASVSYAGYNESPLRECAQGKSNESPIRECAQGKSGDVKREVYSWDAGGRESEPLYLEGGEGIGVVTKAGLSCPVGMAAINPVPRRMIFEAVDQVRQRFGFGGSLVITVWIPEGEELAAKTFNSKLGIVGGLSVLGTSGVVEPMSEKALLATIGLEIHMRAVEGKKCLILTPGNYGERFLAETLGIRLGTAVQCSNFVWEAMRMAGDEGMKEILFVGHLGKLIKVAGGVKNTHSQYGDRRMEILWDCVKACLKVPSKTFAYRELKKEILSSNTTEEAVTLLLQAGILDRVMVQVVKRIEEYCSAWIGGSRVHIIVFTLEQGVLGMSSGASGFVKGESLSFG